MMNDWAHAFRKDVREVTNESRWSLWYVFTRLIIPAIGIGLIVACIDHAINIASTPAAIVEKTLAPDNVISNYEWFKQTNEDVGAMDKQIITAQSQLDSFTSVAGDRANWDFRDKEESARLSSIVTGLKNNRASTVATYNARAKMANREIFMRGVPSHIE